VAQKSAEHRARVDKLNQRRQALQPLVVRLGARLEAAIASTLPFQRQQRREEVRKIRERFSGNLIDVEAAIAQLWAVVEDEIRLGRESGIYRQTLTVEGKEHLVEVARVGMAMLFFKTGDGRYGLLERQGNDWVPEVLTRKEESKMVATLFDSFRKQIRTGFFTVPNPARRQPRGGQP
jgi:hypothetical protein